MSAYSDRVMSLAPIAYWRLGATPLSDSSGNGRTLTVAGTAPTLVASLITGDADGARNFANGDGYQCAHSAGISPPPPRSFEAWCKPAGSASGFLAIVWKGQNTIEYIFRINGLALNYVFTDPTFRSLLSANCITYGQTYHLVCTDDNVNILFYANGSLVSTVPRPSAASSVVPEPLGIGTAVPSNPNDVFNGPIDEIAIYNKVLTPQQILDNYQIGLTGIGLAGPTVGSGGKPPPPGTRPPAEFWPPPKPPATRRVRINRGLGGI